MYKCSCKNCTYEIILPHTTVHLSIKPRSSQCQLILTAGDRFHSRVTLILTLRSVRILRYRLFYFLGLMVSRISAAVLGYKNNNYNLCPSLPVT